MSLLEVDVAVLGAGPAGALAARELARRGRSVALIGDVDSPHRLESLTAPPARLLTSIGLAGVLGQSAVARVRQVDVRWRALAETHEPGPDGPLLVGRPRLERLLGEAALELGVTRIPQRVRRIEVDAAAARVQLVDGERVLARLVVDAAGRRARFRPRPRPTGPSAAAIGFRARAEPCPPAAMQLTACADGWVWMARLANGRVHGVYVTDPPALAGLDDGGRRRFLAERVTGIGSLEPIFVAEAGTTHMPHAVDGSVIRIGDAALARDPISSHGLAQSLGSAARAAIAVDTLLDPNAAGDAAIAFLNARHDATVEEARRAIARCYAEQERFVSPFWQRRAAARSPAPTTPTLAPHPAAADKLRVSRAATLVRHAVLTGDRISWSQALVQPVTGRSTAFLGGRDATFVRSILARPGTRDELARRLNSAGVGTSGHGLVDELWRTGVLVAADSS